MIIQNNKTTSALYKGTKEILKRYKGTLVVYEAFKKLIASGVPPLTLQKCKGVDLVDYKIYGNSKQEILPSTYQEVEYIESTGSQYIDTGFMPNQDSSVEIYGHQINREANSLFGVNPYFVITSGSAKYRFRYNNTSIDTAILADTLVKIALKKNEAYINDELIGTFEVGEFQTTYNALLFGRVSSSGSVEETKTSRIYYVKIWDNDVLVRHFIPCYRKSDNAIGMYDLIDKTFYGNVGTGVFLKGNDTSSLPTPETPIEVESVGDKSKNLFPEEMLLLNSNVTKTEEGYANKGYPATYSIYNNQASGALINHLKKVIKPNTTYTLSRKVSNYINSSSGSMAIRSSSGALVTVPLGNGIKSATFSLTQEQIDSIYNVYIYGLSSNPTIFEWIQLEEGDTVTDYEPYGYRIPITVSGESLFNKEIAKDDNNWSSGKNTYARYLPLVFKKGVHYKILMDDNLCWKGGYPYDTSSSQVALVVNSKNAWGGTIIGNSTLASQPAIEKDIFNETEDTYLVLYYSGEVTKENVFETLFPNLRIYEEGLEPRTTDIYLNEPLRKAGDYADYIQKEIKIINGEEVITQKVVRQLYDTDLSNNNYVVHNTVLKDGYYRNGYFQTIGETKMVSGSANKGFCNVLSINNGYWDSANSDTLRLGQSNPMFYLYTKIAFTTKDEVLSYLGDIHVIYPLATPIEEEIELPNILLNKGTNIIEVNTNILPSNMEVKYYGKE